MVRRGTMRTIFGRSRTTRPHFRRVTMLFRVVHISRGAGSAAPLLPPAAALPQPPNVFQPEAPLAPATYAPPAAPATYVPPSAPLAPVAYAAPAMLAALFRLNNRVHPWCFQTAAFRSIRPLLGGTPAAVAQPGPGVACAKLPAADYAAPGTYPRDIQERARAQAVYNPENLYRTMLAEAISTLPGVGPVPVADYAPPGYRRAADERTAPGCRNSRQSRLRSRSLRRSG